jgi:hypothetical protein
MYRVIAILSGGLALAACSTNLDLFKSGPTMETVRFESEPPGAEAKVSNGQTCRTPCALAMPAAGAYAVTFTLNGFEPETDQIEVASIDGADQLRPNPVVAALTPMPPPPKPVIKKPVRKKTAAKPAPKPAAPAPAAAAAPPPMAPMQQQAPSPWPEPAR